MEHGSGIFGLLPSFGILAHYLLLYLGEAPTVHVPTPEVRAWRELINCPDQLVAKRTWAKNTVRALLRSAGVVPRRSPACGPRRG